MSTPRRMPAPKNRMPTIHDGVKSSTVDFTTTVPSPQMAVAKIMSAL